MENAIYTPEGYTDRIRQELGNCLIETNLSQGEKFIGKARDRYDLGDRMVLIATDRQSAFDRVLAAIPFKGQALNLTSAWWFEQTRHIVPNQVLSIPDPNVTIAKNVPPSRLSSWCVHTSPEARTPPSGWSTRVVSVTTVATICPTA